jgi:uncharacterized delta-60 repeat protein
MFAFVIGLFLIFNQTIKAQSAPDGFDPNANSTVRAIVVQADGKILIGGDFTTVAPNGGMAVARNRIARFNPDGTVDTAFDPNANNTVFAIAVQSDGKILTGGFFNSTTAINGNVTRNYIARLETTGTVDTAFNPNASDSVLAIAVQSDGKILIGGEFTTVAPNGGAAVTRNRIARLGFAPTATSVFISGRVVAPLNLGLTGALVTLTDMQGNSRMVKTVKAGRFVFTDVAVGETYILSVQSKRYQYSPQVITVTEDMTELDFAPQ